MGRFYQTTGGQFLENEMYQPNYDLLRGEAEGRIKQESLKGAIVSLGDFKAGTTFADPGWQDELDKITNNYSKLQQEVIEGFIEDPTNYNSIKKMGDLGRDMSTEFSSGKAGQMIRDYQKTTDYLSKERKNIEAMKDPTLKAEALARLNNSYLPYINSKIAAGPEDFQYNNMSPYISAQGFLSENIDTEKLKYLQENPVKYDVSYITNNQGKREQVDPSKVKDGKYTDVNGNTFDVNKGSQIVRDMFGNDYKEYYETFKQTGYKQELIKDLAVASIMSDQGLKDMYNQNFQDFGYKIPGVETRDDFIKYMAEEEAKLFAAKHPKVSSKETKAIVSDKKASIEALKASFRNTATPKGRSGKIEVPKVITDPMLFTSEIYNPISPEFNEKIDGAYYELIGSSSSPGTIKKNLDIVNNLYDKFNKAVSSGSYKLQLTGDKAKDDVIIRKELINGTSVEAREYQQALGILNGEKKKASDLNKYRNLRDKNLIATASTNKLYTKSLNGFFDIFSPATNSSVGVGQDTIENHIDKDKVNKIILEYGYPGLLKLKEEDYYYTTPVGGKPGADMAKVKELEEQGWVGLKANPRLAGSMSSYKDPNMVKAVQIAKYYSENSKGEELKGATQLTNHKLVLDTKDSKDLVTKEVITLMSSNPEITIYEGQKGYLKLANLEGNTIGKSNTRLGNKTKVSGKGTLEEMFAEGGGSLTNLFSQDKDGNKVPNTNALGAVFDLNKNITIDNEYGTIQMTGYVRDDYDGFWGSDNGYITIEFKGAKETADNIYNIGVSTGENNHAFFMEQSDPQFNTDYNSLALIHVKEGQNLGSEPLVLDTEMYNPNDPDIFYNIETEVKENADGTQQWQMYYTVMDSQKNLLNYSSKDDQYSTTPVKDNDDENHQRYFLFEENQIYKSRTEAAIALGQFRRSVNNY